MVKKRLEDLLREEAQKSPNSEVASEQVIELEATVVPETDAEQPPEPANTSSGSATADARRTNQTKAELETTLKELKAALQASEADNSSLQQQISTMRSDLQQQEALVEKLRSELDETKQLILKLSESNSQAPASNSQALAKNKSGKSQSLALSKLPKLPQSPTADSLVVVNPEPDIGWFD